MNARPRRIAHLDMDAFYASVELLRYPELRGQPVVIGGRRDQQPVQLEDGSRKFARLRDYTGRGVITTSTYEARTLGVFSGMGVMKAAQLAPDAFLLPVDFDAYRHFSRLFKGAVSTIAPLIEDRGIDEIYIDLSELPEDSHALAQRIKTAVSDATGLTCSIGITPNKLLSKMASELDKPNGITILNMSDIPTRIWPLSVKKINGVGPKATEKLSTLGIATIQDLAQADPIFLQTHFGRAYGHWLHEVAHGIDERAIVTYSEPKSLSRESTFEKDLDARHDRATLTEIFTHLCTRVAEDLRRKGYLGRTIGIKLRFDDFRTLTRDVTLPTATDDPAVIRRAAGECLRRVTLNKRLRLLGVRVGTLSSSATPQDMEAAQGELPLIHYPDETASEYKTNKPSN